LPLLEMLLTKRSLLRDNLKIFKKWRKKIRFKMI
jgi:hypothetical protein